MASITTSLPKDVRTWIEQEVAAGHFDSEETVITAAVQRLMKETYRWEEDEDLLEAIAEIDRDGGEVWTPELRHRLREEARLGADRNDPVSDDVIY